MNFFQNLQSWCRIVPSSTKDEVWTGVVVDVVQVASATSVDTVTTCTTKTIGTTAKDGATIGASSVECQPPSNAFRGRAFSAHGETINRSGALGADDGGPASIIDQSGAHGTEKAASQPV